MFHPKENNKIILRRNKFQITKKMILFDNFVTKIINTLDI